MSSPVDIAVELSLGASSPARGEAGVDASWAREAAFLQLIRSHADPIHALARRLTGNAADAEELVQETFLKAWRAMSRFRHEAKPTTWLYRILVNTWRDRERKRLLRERRETRVGRATRDPAIGLAQRDLLEAVLLAVESLPRRQRECLLLRVRADLGHAEIAALLGIGEGTVKTHLLTARRKLVRQFRAEVEG